MMSISFLAVLVSLAMMLTGAGAGEPGLAAKTLTISDVTITLNDETVALEPTLRLGAMTDGERAVYDVAVVSGGEELFPMQLAADGEAVTALLVRSGAAFSVPGSALEAVVENSMQAYEEMAGMAGANAQTAEMMEFMFNEYIPAYTALMKTVSDPEAQAEIQAASQAAFDAVVDRGEGTPDTVEYNGETYEATKYTYTLDSAQLAAVVDEMYTSSDTLKAYYDAQFKMYAMLPEEAGLGDVASYRDLFEKTNLDMTADATEWKNDDGFDLTEVVMTADIQKMMVATLEAQGGDASELPELTPVVINITGVQVGDATDMVMSMDYAMGDELTMAISSTASQSPVLSKADIDFSMTVQGETMTMNLVSNSDVDESTGDTAFSASCLMTVPGDQGSITVGVEGVQRADGTSDADVALGADVNGANIGFTCHLNTGVEPFEDLAASADAFEISDLSNEGMASLSQDQDFAGKLMQVQGTIMEDAGKLMSQESVAQLVQFFTANLYNSYELTESYEDRTYADGEDGEAPAGEMAFNVPEFTYLPEGWSVTDVEVDTEYGTNVSVTLENSNNSYSSGSAYFYESYKENTTEYIMAEDGTLVPLEGDVVTISNSYGSWSVNRDDGVVNANLYLYGDELDFETVSAILAGIQY